MRSVYGLLFALLLVSVEVAAQSAPATIESEGAAKVEVVPEFLVFRLERSFSGPTLTEAMRQVRAFERSVAQGLTDLELNGCRQDTVRVRVKHGNVELAASISLTLTLEANDTATGTGNDRLVEIADRFRKLGVSVSADLVFGGYDVQDREAAEAEAVGRAAENAFYLADAAGTLAQRHVADVERITIVSTRWEGLTDSYDGSMPVPPQVTCTARVRIEYRYESSGTP